jgi:hypothetical protein
MPLSFFDGIRLQRSFLFHYFLKSLEIRTIAATRTMASSTGSSRFSRFQLPGLNLPLNWTPHEPYTKFTYAPNSGNNNMITTNYPVQGEGKNLFRTALNDADCSDGYVS